MKKSMRLVLFVVFALLLASSQALYAQNTPTPAPSADPAGGQPQKPKKVKLDAAAKMDRHVELLKPKLGATDQEWVALKPLLAEVVKAQTIQGDTIASLSSGPKKKNNGQASAPAPAGPDAAGVALSTALAENAPTDQLKIKMEAYRAAIKKADEALKAAREKLRQVLTIKQEATLLLLGYMD